MISFRFFRNLRYRNTRRRTQPFHSEVLETRTLPATIVVNSLADVSGDDTSITLREAIEAANNDSTVNGFYGSYTGDGADVIEFTVELRRQFEDGIAAIYLTEGPLEIRSEIEINGEPFDQLFIDGRWQTGILHVTETGNASLENVIIQRGSANEGGGIYNAGTLHLANSHVSRNQSADNGGGIFNTGELNLDNVAFNQNGNAIYNTGRINADGTSFLSNSVINNGDLTLANSTLWQSPLEFSGEGSTTVVHSTIYSESFGVTGSGVGSESILLHNTVVTGPNCDQGAVFGAGEFVAAESSGNFISAADDPTAFSDSSGNQIGTCDAPLDAMLAAPVFYDSVLSAAPLPGSPLIDAGDDSIVQQANGSPARFDQRGLSRSVGNTDTGAVEFNSTIELTFDDRHQIQFSGTNDDDFVIVVPTGPAARVTIGSETFPINSLIFVEATWDFDLLDGDDQLRFHFDEFTNVVVSETLVSASASAWVSGLDLTAANAEHVRVDFDSELRGDIFFEGSDGDDIFVARNERATMTGSGYSFIAEGYRDVTAQPNGGHNIAQIAMNDYEEVIADLHAEISSSGGSQIQGKENDQTTTVSAWRMDELSLWVNALDGSITDGRAQLRGNDGDDRFEIGPGSARMVTEEGVTHSVFGKIEHTIAIGRYGRDTAVINGSSGDDIVWAAADPDLYSESSVAAEIEYEPGVYADVASFDVMVVNSGGGNDMVGFQDSQEAENRNDVAVFGENYAVMRSRDFSSNEGYFIQVNDFLSYEILGLENSSDDNRDFDELQIVVPTGVNQLIVGPIGGEFWSDPTGISLESTATGQPTRTLKTAGFHKVTAIAPEDGEHTIEWTDPLDYAFHRIGNWIIN